MSDLISVIVPYHHDGDIILDSVGRLLNIPNVEIIVVDDGRIVADGPREQVVEALQSGRVGRASQ